MATCRYCGRGITYTPDGWIDVRATGDDAIWRETCDRHDTFTAAHEPTLSDSDALDAMHAALDGVEWNADLWADVAELILATGRAAFTSPDDAS
jgi:hypothetical protein